MLKKIIPLFLILLWAPRLSAAPPELLFAKGVVAFSQGKLDEAARHFLQVLDEDDAHVQARAYLGQVELARGRLAEAEKHLRKALVQQPDNPALRLDLALALIKMERFGQAEQFGLLGVDFAVNFAQVRRVGREDLDLDGSAGVGEHIQQPGGDVG